LKTDISGTGVGLAVSGNTIKPVRRIVVAGSDSVARFIDVAPSISIVPLALTAGETGPSGGAFFVTRSERLPFPTQVFLSLAGTATVQQAFPFKAGDYTTTGISLVGPIASR